MKQEDAQRINGAFAHTNNKVMELEQTVKHFEQRIASQQKEIDTLRNQFNMLLARTFNGGSTSGNIG